MPASAVSIVEDSEAALKVVRKVMGWYHWYYAKAAVLNGARGLVAVSNGSRLGAAIFYEARLDSLRLGVIYYVAVKRGWQGRGIGKSLVATAENILSLGSYIATLSSDNERSARLFKGLGYEILDWESLARRFGNVLAEAIYYATCSYEDDIVAVKGLRGLERVSYRDVEAASRIWDAICYYPWLSLARRNS